MSDNIISLFGERTQNSESNSAEGVITDKQEVLDKLELAKGLDLDEVVIIGNDPEALHYIHSGLSNERIVYLLEKMKAMILSGDYADY